MIKQLLLFLIPLLLFSGFVVEEEEPEVIHVIYPEFVRWRYRYSDSPHYLDMYDKDKKEVRAYADNYLSTVDSCCWYQRAGIVYSADSAEQYTVKKVIETYKRISTESWLHNENGRTDTLYENRTLIVSADTIQVENYYNPGFYFIHIIEYYSVSPR